MRGRLSSEVALGQRFSAPRNLELIILRVVEVRDGESWCKDALCPALFCGKCDQRGSVQPALIEVVSQIGEDPLQRFLVLLRPIHSTRCRRRSKAKREQRPAGCRVCLSNRSLCQKR